MKVCSSRGSYRMSVRMQVAALALSGSVVLTADLRADPTPASVLIGHDAFSTVISSSRQVGAIAGVFEGTGADQCADATVIPITVGARGEPATIVILGDNTPATGPDCDTVFQGAPMWWEAFEIDREASVSVVLCGTEPVQRPSTPKLIAACPEPGTTTCGADVLATFTGRNFFCDDGNFGLFYDLLPPGIYYYPVFSNGAVLQGGQGPYQITIIAEGDLIIDPCTEDCVGPDVITGHVAIQDGRFVGGGLSQLGREGEIGSGTVGLGVDTTSCNKGDVPARWFALPSVDHPVMTGNLYRMDTVAQSVRFEQVGQAWIKHGFGSANANECGFGCGCPAGGCRVEYVEVGCSDTYSGGQFEPCGGGSMGLMAPRAIIHPYTGAMPEGGDLGPGGGCDRNFPAANHIGHDHPPPTGGSAFGEPGILHRLQVRDVELTPELNEGSRYFAEGLYIVPHEYVEGNGNQNNNVSYRECAVEGPDEEGVFTFPMLTDTFAEQPAIRAWPGASFSRIEPAPMSDGIATLAYEVTDLGNGTWHYEYVLHNQNMDRSMGAFPCPCRMAPP